MTSLQNDKKNRFQGEPYQGLKLRGEPLSTSTIKIKKTLGDSTKNVKKHGAKRKSFIFGVGALPKYN
jgi:hypothetical protein